MYKTLGDKIIYENNKKEIMGEACFKRASDTIDVYHIFVNERYRGRGIASEFMNILVNYCKENNLKLICTCPYAKAWMEKNGGE